MTLYTTLYNFLYKVLIWEKYKHTHTNITSVTHYSSLQRRTAFQTKYILHLILVLLNVPRGEREVYNSSYSLYF